MLANTISNSDEMAVQEELEALEKEELAKKIPIMPDVPTTIKVPPVKDQSAEDAVEAQEVASPEERQAVLA